MWQCMSANFLAEDSERRKMTEYIAGKIRTADLVLVGIGEELDTLNAIKKESWYQDIIGDIKESWMLPFAEKLMLERKRDEKTDIYKKLARCLEGKSYFVVSLCQDGFIKESGLDMQRIVEPCGGYEKMQCSEKCGTDLYDVPSEELNQIKGYINDKNGIDKCREPLCPSCGKPLVFNNVSSVNYVEESYLGKWLLYKKWLQGTVNKNVCILEIGVGMQYPTVIRWPFEKISFYNQKAEFFRVHSKFYQIPAEMKERGHGICQSPEEFIKELSDFFSMSD